ncbi:hypothetical protein KQH21_17265 [Streptomyces sp. IpFD-1.1]|uniref:hypothetical protein n=1 Tax=Streptomyces TaxID=1883 RepID=UPI0013EE868D|nr:hypothetical protein [Streptomyces sp. IpFD-1.1]
MTADGKAYYYLADETGAKTNTYAYSPRAVIHTTHTTEKIPQPYLYAEGDPVNPSRLAWYSPIASAAKSLIRGAKPAPAFFVACYTYNSLTDDGPARRRNPEGRGRRPVGVRESVSKLPKVIRMEPAAEDVKSPIGF